MKTLLDNMKKAIIDGFFIVLPALLILMLLEETLQMLNEIAKPVAAQIPVNNLLGINTSTWLAILLILFLLFFVGTIAHTAMGLRVGDWLTNNLLYRLPGYKLVHTISRQFAGTETDSLFAPAIVSMPLDTEVIAFITEEHDSGDYTILIPNAPTPMVGTIHFVKRDKVRKIDVPLNKVIDCVMKWGIGSAEIFSKSKAQ